MASLTNVNTLIGAVLLLRIYCTGAAPAPPASSLTLPRVRREIRDIDADEREAVLDALWQMKKISTEEGRKSFGHAYISYDDIVVKHLEAAADPRCDQAHLGPAFITFHRAFTLLFEESLLAIDPTISALPYWDYNREGQMKDPRQSILWSDDWFGPADGDPAAGFAVTRGRFAEWGPGRAKPGGIGSPHGFLRSPWNNNPSPRLTRSRYSCGSETQFQTLVWDVCLEAPSFAEWYACIDPTVHTWAHSFLGGVWHTAHNCSRVQCYLENAVWVPSQWKNGCVTCPQTGACNAGSSQACECTISNETRCGLDRLARPISTYGDFADAWSSPNDPIFFFHHANVDRHFMTWQRIHHTAAPEYGFPKSNDRWPLSCEGHGLSDIVSSRSPFVSLFDAGDSAPLTNYDILNATEPSATPYTYDTLQGCTDKQLQCQKCGKCVDENKSWCWLDHKCHMRGSIVNPCNTSQCVAADIKPLSQCECKTCFDPTCKFSAQSALTDDLFVESTSEQADSWDKMHIV